MANTAIVNGTNMVLYVRSGDTNIPFAASKSCSFDVSTDMTDVTCLSSGWFREFKPDMSTWTITCDGLITIGDNIDYKNLLDYQLARTKINIRFTIPHAATTTTINGYGFITSVSIGAPSENAGTYSVSIQGTGVYTFV